MTQPDSSTIINEAEIFNVEKHYYENGKTRSETPLDIKGTAHGVEKTYRRNSMLWTEIPYNHGIRQGTTRFYLDNGDLYEEQVHDKGVLISTTKHDGGKSHTINHTLK